MTIVLVTGAGGFLGPSVVERLLTRSDLIIRCMVRSSVSLRLQQLVSRHPDRIEIVPGNLLSATHITGVLRDVDTVFHLAAGLRGSPADIFLNTVVASKQLLSAISDVNSVRRVVLISSFSVYGAATQPKGALIDEEFALDAHPERRDPYSFAKARQEQLFVAAASAQHSFELITVRPGVIYGPGGGGMSTRVGLRLPGMLLHLGRNNLLPLTYVENCAEAVAVAGTQPYPAPHRIVNVHDDDLPSSRRYLNLYRSHVEKLRFLTLPYSATMLLARMVEWYHAYSKGQLPALITPYKAAALWKGNRFSNARLKAMGWRQIVPTRDALMLTFEHLKDSAETPAADAATKLRRSQSTVGLYPHPSPPSLQLAASTDRSCAQ